MKSDSRQSKTSTASFGDNAPSVFGSDLDKLISDRIARRNRLYVVEIHTIETVEALPAEILNWAEDEGAGGKKEVLKHDEIILCRVPDNQRSCFSQRS